MTAQHDNPRVGTYAVGYGGGAIQWLEMRHAAHHAAFFLPYLQPGMRLLDCGCGSGSITVGLAEAVSPGQALGIDLEPRVIERAGRRAREIGIANARFQAGSVFQLPFESDSFDAVFAHALLEHLGEPLRAIREMRRVLRLAACWEYGASTSEGGSYIRPTKLWSSTITSLKQFSSGMAETCVSGDGWEHC